MLGVFNSRRHRRNAELNTLLVVSFRLHVLRQVPRGLEGDVAVATRGGPEVRVRPDVLLQHGRLLTPDAAVVAYVATSSATSYVCVVVIEALVATFHGRRS